MEKHDHDNNGGGFVIGVLAGVAVTLLFTTEKGRKVLKVLSEEGMEKLEEWEEILKNMQDSDDEDEVEGDDYIPESMPVLETPVESVKQEHHTEQIVHEESTATHPAATTRRRFFKRK